MFCCVCLIPSSAQLINTQRDLCKGRISLHFCPNHTLKTNNGLYNCSTFYFFNFHSTLQINIIKKKRQSLWYFMAFVVGLPTNDRVMLSQGAEGIPCSRGLRFGFHRLRTATHCVITWATTTSRPRVVGRGRGSDRFPYVYRWKMGQPVFFWGGREGMIGWYVFVSKKKWQGVDELKFGFSKKVLRSINI